MCAMSVVCLQSLHIRIFFLHSYKRPLILGVRSTLLCVIFFIPIQATLYVAWVGCRGVGSEVRVSALGGVVGGGSACALPCGRSAVCPAWAVRAVGGLGVGQRAGLLVVCARRWR